MNAHILGKYIFNFSLSYSKIWGIFKPRNLRTTLEQVICHAFLTTWYIWATFLCLGKFTHLSNPNLFKLENESIPLMSSPAIWPQMWQKFTQLDCSSNSGAESPLTRMVTAVDRLWVTMVSLPTIPSRSQHSGGAGAVGSLTWESHIIIWALFLLYWLEILWVSLYFM